MNENDLGPLFLSESLIQTVQQRVFCPLDHDQDTEDCLRESAICDQDHISRTDFHPNVIKVCIFITRDYLGKYFLSHLAMAVIHSDRGLLLVAVHIPTHFSAIDWSNVLNMIPSYS